MKFHLKLVLILGFVLAAGAQAAAPKSKAYASPEEAYAALVAALKSGKPEATAAVLGPKAMPLLSSGDKVADQAGRERFLKAYDEANKLEKSGEDMVILSVGKDAWPFPIPVVRDKAGWRFDVDVGGEEILNRRIGRNELFAIQAVLAYVDAQRDYYLANPQKAKLSQYAQRIGSSPGKRDGLYYPTKAGEPLSPLGPRYESAVKEGYKGTGSDAPGTYHGYKYRILTGQGPDAPGGAYDYVAKGAMIGGFALVAWPATYGNSGIMTFIVNHDGVVYEKDLGLGTGVEVQKIKRFNPDKTWKKVEAPKK